MTHHHRFSGLIIHNVSRRDMLKGIATAGGLVLAAQIPGLQPAFAYPTGAEQMPDGVRTDPHIFLSIAKDGTVTIVAARAEMGTGAARTTLPMIIADELEANFDRVRIVQGEGDEKKYGNQDTDGSRSVRHWLQPLRQCGASARLMLEQAAAKRWNVAVGEVQAVQHELVHKPTGRKLGYGEVAEEAAALPTPTADQIRLKDPSAFRYIGKGNVAVVDLFDITTGRAIYGQDVMRPGLKFAVIARSPVVGGTIVSYDASAALKVPGVEKVVKIDPTPAPAKFDPLAGVAVIANNTYAALKGRDALKIVWDDGPNRSYDSVAYKAHLEDANKSQGRAQRRRRRQCARLGCEGDHPRVLCATSRTRHDGAPGRDRAAHERQTRGVVVAAEPWRRPRGYCQTTRHGCRRRHGAQHSAGRRLRPQVEMRLCDRSGPARQRGGTQPSEGRVDPRG